MLDIPRIELKEYARNGIMLMAKSESSRSVFKPVRWLGSSRKELHAMPKKVRSTIGRALTVAQLNRRSPIAKVLKGFDAAAVLEIVENDLGSTYRGVYTIRFERAVYVLHVFQKKSKTGAKTPAHVIATVRERLKLAEKDYAEWLAQNPESPPEAEEGRG